jgi:tyrosine-specific transport protein
VLKEFAKVNIFYKKRFAMKARVVGSVLIILGTSVGAGMLALPVVLASAKWPVSLSLLIFCWAIMTVGAFSLLEVSLWLPVGTNLISMAKHTLGWLGQLLTWVVYLFLLYALLCAYLSGASDLFYTMVKTFGWHAPYWLSALITTLVLGAVVYCGLGTVDRLNRLLISVKLVLFFTLFVVISPHVHSHWLMLGQMRSTSTMLMVLLTSFGFAIVVPSLRKYLHDDALVLKKVIFIGSLLPLIIYALWIFIIQGIIPRTGSHGLLMLQQAQHMNSSLMYAVTGRVDYAWLAALVRVFISICVLTSFLGVSVAMTDFVADGLGIAKKTAAGAVVFLVTYLPPFAIICIAPSIFIHALAYAGICCAIILILLPLLMLYRGRQTIGQGKVRFIPGGNKVLLSLIVMAIIVLYFTLQQVFV